MTLCIGSKEIEGVLKTETWKRYKYFMGKVADQEEVWGLYDDRWALARDNKGHDIFPLWPAAEYASLCALELWRNYKPKQIPLDDLLEKLLPKLKNDGILIGVFFTPNNKGVVVDRELLINTLITMTPITITIIIHGFFLLILLFHVPAYKF